MSLKSLEIGDLVVDLETTAKWNKLIVCEVIKKDDIGIVLYPLDTRYKVGYPHRFRYNDKYDEEKIFPLNDVNTLRKEFNIKIDEERLKDIEEEIIDRFGGL